jgi:hypothetical protein
VCARRRDLRVDGAGDSSRAPPQWQ